MAVTLEQFVANLIHSGLMSAEEVSAFREGLPPERRTADVQGFARELVHAGKITKYQAAAIYQGKTRGLVLGDYVVLDEIGAGGMGQVFKARHRRMNRIVAVKLLPAAAMRSPDAVRRFYREVEAAARLAHPNIVTAHDAGEHEGLHYLVMEYVEGRDLARVVGEEGPLPIARAVDCVLQAARGLEYAHRQGVVHRDIKPGNLLVDREGTVKILDMGLARMQSSEETTDRTGSERLTGTGQVMGTCDYMAPEQAEDTHAADHRADVYALGCTLYRLLTGDPPYTGETLVQVLLAHLQAPIPSLCDARPDVPPELDAVCRKMMAKRPEDRYQSMGEVIAELERCRHGERPGSPPPPPVSQAVRSTTDSKLNAFLEGLSRGGVAARRKAPPVAQETIAQRPEQETGPISARGRSPEALSRKRLLLLGIGGGTVALLLLVAATVAVLGRPGKEPEPEPAVARAPEAGESADTPAQVELTPRRDDTCLILNWPAAQRDEAVLEIDGQAQDLSELAEARNPDRLRIPLKAGPHKLWIARRGAPPFERAFQLDAGASTTIVPVWPMPEDEEPPRRAEVAATGPSDDETIAKEAATDEPKPPVEPAPAPSEPPEIRTAEQARQAAEARYAAAVAPAEEMIAAGRFDRALAALEQIQFEERDLTARLDRRRNQVERLVALKTRIMGAINAADPPFEKSDLRIRGANGQIVKADEEGITATLRTGKTETLAWPDVGPQAVQKLVQLVCDDQNADDHVAAGLLALVYDDAAYSEALFHKARDLGAEIEPYLGPLASSAFARVEQLIEQKEFHEADTGLTDLEAKYADTPWFASHRPALESARAAIRTGIPESEAEELYAEAAKRFGEDELFDVKPLVEELKSKYADTNLVRDTDRQPSFAELEAAVTDLGVRLTVRLDGQGDFKTIQAAIDAAPPNSLIEIQDNGPYNEKLVISEENRGLTLRGKKGCWPIITSLGPNTSFPNLVTIASPEVTIERLVLAHGGAAGDNASCVSMRNQGPFSLRLVIAYCVDDNSWRGVGRVTNTIVENCVLASTLHAWGGDCTIKDSVAPSRMHVWQATLENVACRFLENEGECNLRFCTIFEPVQLRGDPSSLKDCIVPSVESARAGDRIEFCNVFAIPPFIDAARPGEGCFGGDPQLVNPKHFDYRLLPTSPCIGKASDGGDLGCRYTPAMIEMLTLALQLRQQGIIKF